MLYLFFIRSEDIRRNYVTKMHAILLVIDFILNICFPKWGIWSARCNCYHLQHLVAVGWLSNPLRNDCVVELVRNHSLGREC